MATALQRTTSERCQIQWIEIHRGVSQTRDHRPPFSSWNALTLLHDLVGLAELYEVTTTTNLIYLFRAFTRFTSKCFDCVRKRRRRWFFGFSVTSPLFQEFMVIIATPHHYPPGSNTGSPRLPEDIDLRWKWYAACEGSLSSTFCCAQHFCVLNKTNGVQEHQNTPDGMAKLG